MKWPLIIHYINVPEKCKYECFMDNFYCMCLLVCVIWTCMCVCVYVCSSITHGYMEVVCVIWTCISVCV